MNEARPPVLDGNAAANVRTLHQTLATTTDLRLLTAFWTSPTRMVAYLPHMYFFAIPMSMGDCLASLGNLTEAEETYRSVFGYPFINARVEVVKLWTRLARVCRATRVSRSSWTAPDQV